MTSRTGSLIVLAMVLVAATSAVSAHELGQSYVFYRIEDESISGRFEMTIPDLNRALDLDLPESHDATLAHVAPYLERIRAYVRERVTVDSPEGPRPMRFSNPHFLETSFAQLLVLDFSLDPFDSRPQYLDMRFTVLHDVDSSHMNFVVLENEWRSGNLNQEANIALIFRAGDGEQRLELSSSIWRGVALMVELGIHHIWIGIDHVLFLMALLLPSVLQRRPPTSVVWEPVSGFRPAAFHVVKIITLFTLAHSVTLSLAALGIIDLPSRPVESIIALSIAIAAIDIIFPVFRGQIWAVVFGFGLFHGFGFASVLGEMGIPGRFMALSLFGFNLGVEIGQVAIIALVFPVLYFVRNVKGYAFPLVQVGAAGLVFVSLYWFTERAFEVDLPLGGIVQDVLSLR